MQLTKKVQSENLGRKEKAKTIAFKVLNAKLPLKL